MDEKLYTMQELAEHFKVTPRTIFNWRKAGKIKGTRIGGRYWRFTESAVKAAMETMDLSEQSTEKNTES